MKPHPFSVRATFRFAWTTYKNHIGLFIACMLTFFAAWVILEIIVITGQRFGYLLWVAAHLGFLIIFAGMEVGFIQMCLALHDGKQVPYANLFQALHLGVSFLIAQSIYFMIVLTGLVLLILPGAYLGTRYTFYAYTFAEGNSSLKQSFQESVGISQRSMRSLFWFSIFIILFNIIGASILGLGLNVTIPMSVLMKAYIYSQLNDK